MNVGYKSLATDNLVPSENSPAREGGVGLADISRAPPSRAGLLLSLRAAIGLCAAAATVTKILI